MASARRIYAKASYRPAWTCVTPSRPAAGLVSITEAAMCTLAQRTRRQRSQTARFRDAREMQRHGRPSARIGTMSTVATLSPPTTVSSRKRVADPCTAVTAGNLRDENAQSSELSVTFLSLMHQPPLHLVFFRTESYKACCLGGEVHLLEAFWQIALGDAYWPELVNMLERIRRKDLTWAPACWTTRTYVCFMGQDHTLTGKIYNAPKSVIQH